VRLAATIAGDGGVGVGATAVATYEELTTGIEDEKRISTNDLQAICCGECRQEPLARRWRWL
jgi:hypothetical protein